MLGVDLGDERKSPGDGWTISRQAAKPFDKIYMLLKYHHTWCAYLCATERGGIGGGFNSANACLIMLSGTTIVQLASEYVVSNTEVILQSLVVMIFFIRT
jgi:hypothetical protein